MSDTVLVAAIAVIGTALGFLLKPIGDLIARKLAAGQAGEHVEAVSSTPVRGVTGTRPRAPGAEASHRPAAEARVRAAGASEAPRGGGRLPSPKLDSVVMLD